mmetsp:Transcript_9847/g.14829  ORF Transcript_9847/g.14829 Transcript_9847/m.14829 type:complete len:217 (-) Transcript_9847:641-1291(-)
MEDHHKIVVWGLPSSIDIDKLKDMLLVYGEPVRADITRRNTLVYAFVEFRKMQEAAKAVEALNGSRVDKQIISIKLARPRSSSCEPKKVFVYNLPASYTDDQICDLFAQFGEITAYSITWGGDFQSGFFEYKHAHECDAALNILHNSVLEGAHSIYVYYARSPQHTVFFYWGFESSRRCVPRFNTSSTCKLVIVLPSGESTICDIFYRYSSRDSPS